MLLILRAEKENVYVNVTWDVGLLIIWAEKENVCVNVTWNIWKENATYNTSGKRKDLCKCYIRCLATYNMSGKRKCLCKCYMKYLKRLCYL
jgi:hypothetical protein